MFLCMGCTFSAGKKHNQDRRGHIVKHNTKQRTRDVLLELDILFSCFPCVLMLQRAHSSVSDAVFMVNVEAPGLGHALPVTFDLPGRPSRAEMNSPCRYERESYMLRLTVM